MNVRGGMRIDIEPRDVGRRECGECKLFCRFWNDLLLVWGGKTVGRRLELDSVVLSISDSVQRSMTPMGQYRTRKLEHATEPRRTIPTESEVAFSVENSCCMDIITVIFSGKCEKCFHQKSKRIINKRAS
jgi:hypothetical protein